MRHWKNRRLPSVPVTLATVLAIWWAGFFAGLVYAAG